jgi:uncharacterized protein YkwD
VRRFFLVLIFILLGATFVRGWQSSPGVSRAAGCVDVPANPDYLASNSERDAVAAINNARAGEHLRPLRLPDNFYQLDPAQEQFVLINLERTDRGLLPLRLDANLARMAQNYSRQMRDLHFFAHTSPIAGTFSERIDSNPALAGHYALAAENLAGNPAPGAGAMYEYMYDDSVEACGHRENILDANVTLVGIGWAPGSIYGSMSAQEFIGSASWNPYGGVLPAAQTPQVRIVELQDHARNIDGYRWIHYQRWGKRASLVSFQAQLGPGDGKARITWFLDRAGNIPFSGADITLDVSALSPGRHTLFVYAVDGEQNYGVASYAIVV